MKEKKPIKKSSIIINTIFFLLIGFLATYYVWNFIDIQSGYKYPTFGIRSSVIVSPSMSTVNEANNYITSDMKQIQKYDVVNTVNYKSFNDIKIYDIATYYDGSKNLVCHRVIDKYESEGKQYVVFRGDANAVSDVPVSYDLVRGKVTNIIPKVGHVVAFIQSPYVFIAIFGIGFFVCLGIFIYGRGKDKKKEEPAPQEETNNEEQKPEEINPEPEAVVPVEEEKPAEEVVDEQPIEETKEEEPAAFNKEPVEEDTSSESELEEKKPADKPKKEKTAPKKAKATPKSEKKAVEEEPEEKKEVKYRTYHVNKRKEDGKWTIKFAGGEKVIKLFDTQKEALEYAKKMADNQGGTVLVHASKGAQKGRIKKK